jgi:O-antigen/teichoic acid export membrane protein
MRITSLPIVPRPLAQPPRVGAGGSTDRVEGRGAWQGLLSLISGIHALALADQVVVSAASFLTTVTIGRFTDPSQLGAYAIGISVLASSFTIQGSLITLPYSIQQHRPSGTPAEHAGSSLAHSSLLAALITVVLMVTALSLFALGAQPELTAMTWALAGVMPFALFREFCRRFNFTHLQMARALLFDAAVSAIQLSVLGWLAWTGRLSAVTACGTIGVSCGLVAVGWWYLARADFAFLVGDMRATMKQSWSLGKWLLANQIMVQVQRYATYWLSVVIAGAAVTGVLTACMSIVAFANPLTFGLGNILAPRSVLAWKEKGGAGLRRQAIRDALLLGAVMAAFCVLVLLAGEDAMRFLYHGKEYEGHGHTVAVLAFATLASAIAMPASNALASMERPYAVAVVGAAGAAVTVVLVWWLMAEWGLLGAAYGLLSGNVVSSVGLWIGFLAVVPRSYDSAPVIRVLQTVSQTPDPGRCAIARLGEGDHSNVYSVESKDQRPIWREYRNLVVKLYKPETATIELADAQFDSLSRLHSALDGRTVNGWKISTPKPLHVCKSPLALVMTGVSGKKDLKSCAATDDDLTPEVLQALARAIVAALEQSWSRGQLHGDLALQNILYDIPAKNLSFIDPGTRECCSVCNDVTTRWRPAALELGHVVRDLGTDVRDVIGNPVARFRRQIFVESALQAFIETIGPLQEKQRALDEIRACAHAHLSKVLEPSWSFRGLWYWLLTQFVVRRMDSMLDKLKIESNICDGPRIAADGSERDDLGGQDAGAVSRVLDRHTSPV